MSDDLIIWSHELIYTDGYIAITLYECCYGMWSVCSDDRDIGGSLWQRGTYRLAQNSVYDIKKYVNCRS